MTLLTNASVTTILPVKDLNRARRFYEDYDSPNLKTVNHVCVLESDKAAWFKDTEGNYLCVHEGAH